MRVLLAGATGAIGRPLLRVMAAAGHDVTAVVRTPETERVAAGLGATTVLADVMDRDRLLRAVDGFAFDAVLHQATALRTAGRTVRADDPTVALRDTGTRHLLAAASATGARRFVTQSLITGYGYLDHGTTVLTEDAPFGVQVGNAADPVALASHTTERLAFSADGVDAVALRYGMFYGPGAFSDMFAGLLRKRIPVLPRGATATTGFIHVSDAASATVAALERGRPGTAYNIVDAHPASWRDFVTAVARAHGTPRPVAVPAWLFRRMSPYLGHLMIDTTLRVSAAKAREELGWQPDHADLHIGLGISGAAR